MDHNLITAGAIHINVYPLQLIGLAALVRIVLAPDYTSNRPTQSLRARIRFTDSILYALLRKEAHLCVI